jgi:hypothetical protein
MTKKRKNSNEMVKFYSPVLDLKLIDKESKFKIRLAQLLKNQLQE